MRRRRKTATVETRPCPSWCRHHFGAGGEVVHGASMVEVDRPDRRLSPVEQIVADATGRTPPALAVTAYRIGVEDRIEIAVNGTALVLTSVEARQVGWALLGIGLAVEQDEKGVAGSNTPALVGVA